MSAFFLRSALAFFFVALVVSVALLVVVFLNLTQVTATAQMVFATLFVLQFALALWMLRDIHIQLVLLEYTEEVED